MRSFRTPADPEYLSAIGRAVYNFGYLEGCICDIVARISPAGHAAIPRNPTADGIAMAFRRAIKKATPALTDGMRACLEEIQEKFDDLIDFRNELVHARPHTSPDGKQLLQGREGPIHIENILKSAAHFENLAIYANWVYHDSLYEERPGPR